MAPRQLRKQIRSTLRRASIRQVARCRQPALFYVKLRPQATRVAAAPRLMYNGGADGDSRRRPHTVQERGPMTYVITEPCINVKDAACIDVCPVDCIHPRKDEPGFEGVEQLFIDPEECIDCGACEPECPVNAIYPEDDVPAEYE